MQKKRTSFKNFFFDISKIRLGFFSALYFSKSKKILEKENIKKKVLTQIFHNYPLAKISGIDESIALLKIGTGFFNQTKDFNRIFDQYLLLQESIFLNQYHQKWDDLKKDYINLTEVEYEINKNWVDTSHLLEVKALFDGDLAAAKENVMTIEGPLSYFTHLESIYLGILARSSRITNNVYQASLVAKGKPILFFADRFDRWTNQVSDGYAAFIGGVNQFACPAMGQIHKIKPIGTVPHSLIASFEGNELDLMKKFHLHYPKTNLVALVDFHNDCIKTSLELAKALSEENIPLWGVRVDTSGKVIDKSLLPLLGQFDEIPSGVSIPLIRMLRESLDQNGFKNVKIIASGGFSPERIERFEKNKVPVDIYAIGSYFVQANPIAFTADVVKVNDKPMAKFGRSYKKNKKLHPLNWEDIL